MKFNALKNIKKFFGKIQRKPRFNNREERRNWFKDNHVFLSDKKWQIWNEWNSREPKQMPIR